VAGLFEITALLVHKVGNSLHKAERSSWILCFPEQNSAAGPGNDLRPVGNAELKLPFRPVSVGPVCPYISSVGQKEA
jgi:hypothetical protein